MYLAMSIAVEGGGADGEGKLKGRRDGGKKKFLEKFLSRLGLLGFKWDHY